MPMKWLTSCDATSTRRADDLQRHDYRLCAAGSYAGVQLIVLLALLQITADSCILLPFAQVQLLALCSRERRINTCRPKQQQNDREMKSATIDVH